MENGFLFYRSFYEAIKQLPAEDFKECVMALCGYALDGDEGTLSPMAAMFFTLVKPQVDANTKRRSNGSKGGEATAKQTSSKRVANTEQDGSKPVATTKQTGSNHQAKDKDKDKDKVLPSNEGNNAQAREDPQPAHSGVDVTGMFKSPAMGEAMNLWIDARSAIGPYPYGAITETLSAARTAEERYGAEKCIRVIKDSIAGGYKAITWDRLEKARSGTTQRKTNAFNTFEQNTYDFDALEEALIAK